MLRHDTSKRSSEYTSKRKTLKSITRVRYLYIKILEWILQQYIYRCRPDSFV